ncbi:MAG: peptidylprolyl isomerase [Caldisericaceae bacterium]|nr:peptidylprolyl isomerase [Caldisericaceae bacterium]
MGRESRIRKLRKEGVIAPVREEPKQRRWLKILISVLLVFIILFVIVWMWGYLERDVAAHVGKETIKKAEIQDQIDYYIQMYQQYGIDLTDPSYSEMRTNLEKNIKDSVINQSLLVQYAEAQHLEIDQDAFNENIESEVDQIVEQGIQNQGEEIFNSYVEAQYGSMDEYKEYLRKQLTPYVERPLLSQAALEEQYKTIEITDDDMNLYWNSVYQVDAEHFLLKVEEDSSESDIATAKTQIEDIYDEIMEEKEKDEDNFNFAEFARGKAEEFNKAAADTGKEAARYESLGYFSKGQMVEEFEEACFDPDVNIGDIVGPVKTNFGFHIIHILGKKPMSEKYDEPAMINVRLVLFKYEQGDEKSEENAKMSANSIVVQTKNGMDFIEAVKRFSQDDTTKENDGETGFFAQTERPELFIAAEKLAVGNIAGPIKTNDGYAAIKVIDKKEAVKASLDSEEVYEKVKEDVTNEKKQKVEEEFIETLKQKYKVRTTNPWISITAFFDRHFGDEWHTFTAWWDRVTTGKTSEETPPEIPNTPITPSPDAGNEGGEPLQPIGGSD